MKPIYTALFSLLFLTIFISKVFAQEQCDVGSSSRDGQCDSEYATNYCADYQRTCDWLCPESTSYVTCGSCPTGSGDYIECFGCVCRYRPSDPVPTPTPIPPTPTPPPSCVQTPGSYCCTRCTSCNYSSNYYYNCDGSTYPSGGQFDSGCLYLCAATPTPAPSACNPPGSTCGTCVAATCPDGAPCAAGHTYCVFSATGNYCGSCITEVDNCATQCTGPAATPTPPPAAPTTPPPSGCNFSNCGASGCQPDQRYVSGTCSYSWYSGQGCYYDASCGSGDPYIPPTTGPGCYSDDIMYFEPSAPGQGEPFTVNILSKGPSRYLSIALDVTYPSNPAGVQVVTHPLYPAIPAEYQAQGYQYSWAWLISSAQSGTTPYLFEFSVNGRSQYCVSKYLMLSSTPTCNYDEVSLSVSPNPQNIGGSITFSISGNASTWIEDYWTGGVDCSGAFPYSKTCNATSVGSFTWTHKWKHCVGSTDNCSDLCSETAPFTVIGYTISGSVFIDKNKNRVKDAGEPNYTGSITITSTRGSVTYPAPQGSYKIENLPPGTHTVSYNGPPPGYELTYLNGASVTVGTACSPNGFQGASCDANGSIQDLNFGITNNFPWFQGKGGDMRLDNGFTDPIPTGTYASLEGSGGTPGVIFSGDGSYNFCPGNSTGTCQDRASTKQWVVGGFTYPEVFTPVHSGIIRTAYDYIKTTARQSGLVATYLGTTTICSNLTNCTLPLNFSHGFYTTDDGHSETPDDLYLNSHIFPSNQNYVILVHGDLYIRGNIIVPTTSTVTFSVSGDIIVDKGVGESTSSSTAPNIEGFYSTDDSFIIKSYGAEDGVICNLNGTPRDKRLNMQGSIVVNAGLSSGSFQNERDLCNQAQNPTFYIEERPDFFLNAPELIKHPNFTWQEVAP